MDFYISVLLKDNTTIDLDLNDNTIDSFSFRQNFKDRDHELDIDAKKSNLSLENFYNNLKEKTQNDLNEVETIILCQGEEIKDFNKKIFNIEFYYDFKSDRNNTTPYRLIISLK